MNLPSRGLPALGTEHADVDGLQDASGLPRQLSKLCRARLAQIDLETWAAPYVHHLGWLRLHLPGPDRCHSACPM